MENRQSESRQGFVEQNPHIDYAALTAAVAAEAARPPGERPAPAARTLVTGAAVAAPVGGVPGRGLALRLQRWPRLQQAVLWASQRALRLAVASRQWPPLFFALRWLRWLASLPQLADWVARTEGEGRRQAGMLESALGSQSRQQAEALAQVQVGLQAGQARMEARLQDGQQQATAALQRELALAREELADLRQQLGTALQAGFRAGPAAASGGDLPLPAPGMAAFYQDFEDAWRGEPATIAARVAHYLPWVKAAAAAQPEAPLVDIGCGRGEWLAVLAEAGLTAFGVDSNEAAVARVRAQGLSAFEAEANGWLAARADGSLGGLSALHVVEHLPFEALVKLLDEALRVLRPGGLLILETPDPANMLVATHSFWLDPTHLRPLPAELLAFTVQTRGFEAVEVERLHGVDAALHFGSGDEVAQRLNALLYGTQDYAVIARKPGGR